MSIVYEIDKLIFHLFSILMITYVLFCSLIELKIDRINSSTGTNSTEIIQLSVVVLELPISLFYLFSKISGIRKAVLCGFT